MVDRPRRLDRALAPGGPIVLLHHSLDFADAAQRPSLAHKRAKDLLGRHLGLVAEQRHRRFAVATFEKQAT